MKIGVFGDSFCHDYDSLGNDNYSWYHILRSYGHEVTTFGQSGSSLLWSARQIKQHQHNFDFIIWVVTDIHRISIELDEKPNVIHFTSPMSKRDIKWLRLKLDSSKDKINAANMWYKHLFDMDDNLLMSKGLIHLYSSLYDNLMMIPAFYENLYSSQMEIDSFNLYNLCTKEAEHYSSDVESLLRFDARQCHLSIENNAILAKLINDDLNPGLFQTDYNNFNMHPSAEKNFYFYDR